MAVIFSYSLRLLCFSLLLIVSVTHAEPTDVSKLKPLKERVLTQAEQAALSPAQVFEMLQAGNRRFVDGTLTLRDHSSQVRKAALGQFPKAMILSCVDSRVPVEDVFDRGIGDIFVTRNAGNFVNVDVLGGMEFACKVAGAKLIVVMGHDDCGAVKGAIDNVKLGNLTAMLKNIRPSVAEVAEKKGKGTSGDERFVHQVTKQNVRDAIANIREHSPVLSDMEKAGDIAIVGGVYNMDTGKVDFFKGL
ncbi:MAG: carbonic anhydrase family protein [Pirellulales bacterium]|nr:carbonic anhydrase family protein [Pirellulales bacterium]